MPLRNRSKTKTPTRFSAKFFHPFGEWAFVDPHCPPTSKAGNWLSRIMRSTVRVGYMQQFSSLPESYKTERIRIIFHIGFPAKSNANAITP